MDKPIMETHGRDETPAPVDASAQEEKFQPTLLEQVWGNDGLERYGTSNEDEYNKRLEDMNRPDLEAHARMMGVVILESSLRLKERLLQEFRFYNAALRKPATGAIPTKASEAALRVLAEGR